MRNLTPPSFARESGSAGAEPGAVWRVGGATWSGGVAPYTSENRIFRNGAMIRDWQAGGTYTIVEADRGATLTASVRRRDGSTPTPQEVVVAATGSAVVPSGSVVGTVVSTDAGLAQALQNSAVGDVILLAPGTYNPLSQAYEKGTLTSGSVTVKSQVRTNPARFPNGFGSRSHRGLIFDNFLVGPELAPSRGNRTVIGISGRLTRCVIRNCLLDNCFIGFGFTTGGVNNVIEANEITRWQNDGLRLYEGHRGMLIRNNYFHGAIVNNDSDHSDIMQAAQNTRDGYHEDVVIEYNLCYGVIESFKRTQGFLFRPQWIAGPGDNPTVGVTPSIPAHPEDYPDYAWKRWRIRHNYIENQHAHGIFVCGHVDIQVHGNLLRNLMNTTDRSRHIGITLQGPNSGRIWNNVQRRDAIDVRAGTPWPGNISDFSEFSVTFLSSHTDPTVPAGWSMPNAGRFVLD
jgi:hypothetical protein